MYTHKVTYPIAGLSRRQFLQQACDLTSVASIGVGAMAFAVPPVLASPSKPVTPYHFELSLAQWSLHKAFFSGALSPLDFPAVARNTYGIGAVEYVNQFFLDKAQDKQFLQQLKQRCADNGVHSSLIMVDKEPELASADAKVRAAGVEGHKKWLEAAHFLGCTALRVNLHGSDDLKLWTAGAVESLHALAALSAPMGLKILVENHGGYSSSGEHLAAVMRLADCPNIRTMPDFGNFCIRRAVPGDLWESACVEQYDLYKGVAELMPYAGAISAKAFRFDAQGNEPDIDFFALFRLARAADYRGYVGIEYEGDGMSEEAGIRATKALLERVRASLAQV